MVFNATFNNISVILWQFYWWRKPAYPEKTIDLLKVILPSVGNKHTTLVVLGSDCTGNCKYNIHTTMTIAALWKIRKFTNCCNIKNFCTYYEKIMLLPLILAWKRGHFDHLKVVPYTSGKIWSARLIFLFFWQCVWINRYRCNKYQNFSKFQPTDSEL